MTRKEKKDSDPAGTLIIFGIYCNFIESIKHFDHLQTNFRIMASTALLATFAAIGFIFSAQNKILPTDVLFSAILICLIGLSAIITLWHLDLVFYERLYISSFSELFDLECKHHWLPQVHHNILDGQKTQEKAANVIYYYIGCGGSLILTTGITVSYLLRQEPLLIILLGPIATMAALTFYVIYLKTKTTSLDKSMKQLRRMKR
jgi:hypothetical protein